jgi:hypothetical protein
MLLSRLLDYLTARPLDYRLLAPEKRLPPQFHLQVAHLLPELQGLAQADGSVADDL